MSKNFNENITGMQHACGVVRMFDALQNSVYCEERWPEDDKVLRRSRQRYEPQVIARWFISVHRSWTTERSSYDVAVLFL